MVERTGSWGPPQDSSEATDAPGTVKTPNPGKGRLHRRYLCFWSNEQVPLQGSGHHPHVLRAPNAVRTRQVSEVGRGHS